MPWIDRDFVSEEPFLAPSVAVLAYVDPGSGSLIIQALLAFLAGSLFYLKRVAKLLAGKKSSNEDNDSKNERSADDDGNTVPASSRP